MRSPTHAERQAPSGELYLSNGPFCWACEHLVDRHHEAKGRHGCEYCACELKRQEALYGAPRGDE